MVGAPVLTLELLEERLGELKGQRFELVRGGDGAAGHTLEHLLGLKENNLSVPDWGDFELKTCQRESRTPVTLVSKAPRRIGNISRQEFIAKHGYSDEMGRTGLNCTVSASCVNSRGWQLRVSPDNKRIDIEHMGDGGSVSGFAIIGKHSCEEGPQHGSGDGGHST